MLIQIICFIAKCNTCRTILESAEGYQLHWPSVEEALEGISNADWIVLPDKDTIFCESCSPISGNIVGKEVIQNER